MSPPTRLLLIAPPLILIAVVLVSLGLVLARRAPGGGAFGVNTAGALGSLPSTRAADFSLATMDGAPMQLSALQGNGVVLNFWASWCVPCRDEAPVLARMAKEYEAQSVRFVGVGIWDLESDARAFLSRYGVGYPNVQDVSGRIAIEYGVTGIPETYFVRPDGTLSRRWIGPLAEAQLREFLEEIRP